MDKLNYIERLKDELHASDYKAIKHSEGWLSDEDYKGIRLERQEIRDLINQIELMTEEEFYENYPEELDSVMENFESIEDYPDIDE